MQKQAAEYIIALPIAEHTTPQWQAAMEAEIRRSFLRAGVQGSLFAPIDLHTAERIGDDLPRARNPC
jgi:hypothetical protein